MQTKVIITGLNDVQMLVKRIGKADGFKRGLLAGGQHLKDRAQIYPPKSGRPGDTYRRGIDPRSERLGQRWMLSVSRGGWRVEVGNIASYAGKVHGEEQPWYHRQTGWKKLDQLAREEGPRIERIVASYTEKDL